MVARGPTRFFFPLLVDQHTPAMQIAPFFTSCPSPSDTPSGGTRRVAQLGDFLVIGLHPSRPDLPGCRMRGPCPGPGTLRSPSRTQGASYGTSPSSGTGTDGDYSHTHTINNIRTASLSLFFCTVPLHGLHRGSITQNLSPVSWCASWPRQAR